MNIFKDGCFFQHKFPLPDRVDTGTALKLLLALSSLDETAIDLMLMAHNLIRCICICQNGQNGIFFFFFPPSLSLYIVLHVVFLLSKRYEDKLQP